MSETAVIDRDQKIAQVLSWTPETVSSRARAISGLLVVGGIVGLVLGFAGRTGAGWTALLVATTLVIGFAVCGIVFSAMFQVTGAKWGRPYRRLGEAGVMLMPIGILGLLALLAGGHAYLPWAGHDHHLTGGKAVWLSRGFWDVRVLFCLALAYGLSLAFLYYSLRRDFCLAEVSGKLRGRIAGWVGKGIGDPIAEAERCDLRMTRLAPAQLIVFAVTFTFLGFDLIMALEPDWYSTLFGAWYFMGHMFAGLSLLALISIVLRKRRGMEAVLTPKRQRDLATVLFAFCLLNIDFFWSQYLTIWYANLPEETGYVITRALQSDLPWWRVSWVALAAFFFIPFSALLFRVVKHTDVLLGAVSVIVVAGVFLARFLEIAPPLLHLEAPATFGDIASPLIATGLVSLGMLGGGLWLYLWFLTKVPIMPVGDEIFLAEFGAEETH